MHSDLEQLRICATIQGATIGGPAGFKRLPADRRLIDELNDMDVFDQAFSAGDLFALVRAEYWPSLTKRGMSGAYAVKHVLIPDKRPKRTRFQQFTDALRRVFSFVG